MSFRKSTIPTALPFGGQVERDVQDNAYDITNQFSEGTDVDPIGPGSSWAGSPAHKTSFAGAPGSKVVD